MAKDMYEVRWHARGGQGAKTAAALVAEVALAEGKYSQGFPEYGPERMGAPIRGYTRIAERPATKPCQKSLAGWRKRWATIATANQSIPALISARGL